MKNFPQSFTSKLSEREQNQSLRSLSTSVGSVDFLSNDYLGFAKSKEIFRQAHRFLLQKGISNNGATGSRLLSGNSVLYEETETFLANFHDSEAALIFNSGFDANLGFFGAITDRNTVILYDEYSHASIRDGIKLSHAKAYKFSHNNLEELQQKLILFCKEDRDVFVVTESVFSMDGDSPDLGKLTELCSKHNAFLVIDEAHALGVFGKKGEGLVQNMNLQHKVFARIVTFGKALGAHGAVIVGNKRLKEYLLNFARSFIYTTGLPPHSLATILVAYHHLEKAETQRQQLYKNITLFNDLFEISDLSPIKSIIVQGNQKVKATAQQLQKAGFDVKPILSPTVPQGEERLRFCLHSYNTEQEIRGLAVLLKSLI